MFRYFLTYRGVKLPLCMAEEIAADALKHRNTYFQADFDEQGRMLWVEKLVYGEVEMRHDYRYDEQGELLEARISMVDEEPRTLLLHAQIDD
jgi:Family of unknown function (DUF6156)